MAADDYNLETVQTEPNGLAPNSRFPVLIYRSALAVEGEADPAETIIAHFRQNNWLNNWRYPGIYDYYHFHSTSHEVLGVARGQMQLRLGGEGGTEVTLAAGDVLVQPAGVSHIYLDGSSDILVVGGYPDGRDWDLLREDHITKSEWREAIKLIMSLPIPSQDPVTGGAIVAWQQAPSSLEWGAPREELDRPDLQL